MLALTEAGVASIISATLAGVAAIIASASLVVAARNRRETRHVRDQVTNGGEATLVEKVDGIREQVSNGGQRTLIDKVDRLEADMSEHLYYVAEHMAQLGTPEDASRMIGWMRRRMEEEGET